MKSHMNASVITHFNSTITDFRMTNRICFFMMALGLLVAPSFSSERLFLQEDLPIEKEKQNVENQKAVKQVAKQSAEKKDDEQENTETELKNTEAEPAKSADVPSPAKEPPAKEPPAKGPEESYLELMNAWKELESKLQEKEVEFVVVGESRKNEIRKEYDLLLAEANELTPRLTAAAVASYRSKPNQDPTLVRLLIGMLTDHLAKNRNEEFFDLGQILIEGKVDITHFKAMQRSKRLVSFDVPELIDELLARHQDAEKNNLPRAVITTSYGDIELELFEDSTPNHVANFVKLASDGFYNGSPFHRVDPSNRVVQGGMPADAAKAIDYTLAAEWEIDNPRFHFKGAVGAARLSDNPHSASSEFYIMTDRFRAFDGSYTVFGRVVSGMEFVNRINEGDKMLGVEIIRKRDHQYLPEKFDPESVKKDDPEEAGSSTNPPAPTPPAPTPPAPTPPAATNQNPPVQKAPTGTAPAEKSSQEKRNGEKTPDQKKDPE